TNSLLAQRLLNKELVPSVILTMSPNDLKNGLTAEERTTNEPDRSERMQMTDARCSRCMERKVGVADVIHAGGSGGDRYQLECIACGHTWYASRDDITSLSTDTEKAVANVGTAPLATSKFENVEKKLVSPRDSVKPSGDITQKTAAIKMAAEKKLVSSRDSVKPAGDITQKTSVSKMSAEKKLVSPRDFVKPANDITHKTPASKIAAEKNLTSPRDSVKPAGDITQKTGASKMPFEKKVASPRDYVKPAGDITRKMGGSKIPILESQTSFNRMKQQPVAAKPPTDHGQKSSAKFG
ncbi:hypothetical protein ZOSMA_277G00010, partial [Zostera marina]